MGKYTFPSSSTSSSPVRSLDALGEPRLGISEDLLPAFQNADSSTAKFSNECKKDEALIDRYELQYLAASIMPHEAVACCHMRMIGSTATMVYIPSSDSAAYANFETCHSVWMCAVCSAKISYKRQEELNQAIKAAHELGLYVAMCTYTFSHHLGDDLRKHLDSMLAARRLMVSGRDSQSIREQYGVVKGGYIRVIEVTFGDNGAHPHIHELVFFRPNGVPVEENIAAYGEEMAVRWQAMAAKKGLSMNEHGFHIDSADSRVAGYIAKFGHEPGEKTREMWHSGDWNEAAEMTQWHRKKGTGDHYTPFDLLRFAALGDDEAYYLFKVYCEAFKGRKQLYFPPALRKLLGLSVEKTDKEIIEEHELDRENVAALSAKLFYEHIRSKRHARAKILNQVRRAKGELAPIEEYMASNFEAVIDPKSKELPVFVHIDDLSCKKRHKKERSKSCL